MPKLITRRTSVAHAARWLTLKDGRRRALSRKAPTPHANPQSRISSGAEPAGGTAGPEGTMLRAVVVTVMVDVTVPFAFTTGVPGVQVAAVGAPVQVNVTAPAPPAGVTVAMKVPD
jgi:hypothetical protein